MMCIDDATLAAYRKGVVDGTMKAAAPNVVRQLLDEIDRLKTMIPTAKDGSLIADGKRIYFWEGNDERTYDLRSGIVQKQACVWIKIKGREGWTQVAYQWCFRTASHAKKHGPPRAPRSEL